MADLLPTSRASVSILQGVSEALATEDMATLCRDNETSILHDLGDRKNSLRTYPCPRAPSSTITEMRGRGERGKGQHTGGTQFPAGAT